MRKSILISILLLFVASTIAIAEQHGKASFYSNKLKGHHTTDGGKYHPDSLTCAHLTYPLGTILKVRNPKNDAEVIVKVTDRGPHSHRLIIDLSYSAAEVLDIVRAGIASVEITKLDSMPEKMMALLPLSIPMHGIDIKKTSALIKTIILETSKNTVKAYLNSNNSDISSLVSQVHSMTTE